jgi:hypothetical protein
MSKERFIGKEERAHIIAKKTGEKAPETMRCQGCGFEHLKSQLARFGRQKGSPYLCRRCAEAEAARLLKLLPGRQNKDLIQG